MNAIKVIGGLVGIFVVMPIWYYLLYKVLQRVDASDVMWLLYWVYVPVALLVQIILKIAETADH